MPISILADVVQVVVLAGPPPGGDFITTEAGDRITTESGDRLIT